MTAYANKAQLLANFLTHKKVTFFVNVECVFRCLFMCMSVFVCMLVCEVMRCKIYPPGTAFALFICKFRYISVNLTQHLGFVCLCALVCVRMPVLQLAVR